MEHNPDQPQSFFYTESDLTEPNDEEGGSNRSRVAPHPGTILPNHRFGNLTQFFDQPTMCDSTLYPVSYAFPLHKPGLLHDLLPQSLFSMLSVEKCNLSTSATSCHYTHPESNFQPDPLGSDYTTLSDTNIASSSTLRSAPEFSYNLHPVLQLPNLPTCAKPFQDPFAVETPLIDLGLAETMQDQSRAHRKKRAKSIEDGGAEQRPLKQPRLRASYCIEANDEQNATLEHFLGQWETRDHLPKEKDFKVVAQATGLSVGICGLWYGARLTIIQNDKRKRGTVAHSQLEPGIIQDVERFIVKSQRSDCGSTHASRGRGGKYKCTWGCGYSTDYRNAWERHEEVRQPQRFWHCVSCRAKRKTNGLGNSVYVSSRYDKFPTHATTCAPDEDPQDLRNRSEVQYEAPFLRECGFVNSTTGAHCTHHFNTWRERNDHYVRHFEDEAKARESPEDDNDDDFPDEDDGHNDNNDDDENGDDGGQDRRFIHNISATGNWSATPSHQQESGHWMSLQNEQNTAMLSDENHKFDASSTVGKLRMCCRAYDGSGNSTSALSDLADASGSTDTASPWMIDISEFRMVRAKAGLRFVALKYSGRGPSLACLRRSPMRSCPHLPPIKQLPSLFQKALQLAKDLGFRYIWVDVFCGLNEAENGLDAIYKAASLILVMGHPSQCTTQLWHFWCDYSHINTVQTWAKQSVSFHHLKQLGHGAHSVVDHIQLHPGGESLARKTVFPTTFKTAFTARHVQEIEVMQKFNHPHITRFVAAYYDNSAFNILLTPVADCDLRRFLACPKQFPGKRAHLPTWFMSLAEALARMHKGECRHKDIKPANILISGNKVLLADFGASFDFSTSVSTSTGGTMLTPKYCAPEVAAKGDRGRSADVFSLGCVFAEMITLEMGSSLDNMHAWLGMEQESSDRSATYHYHLPDLVEWLEVLTTRHPTDHQRRVLRATASMIAHDPARRPTASAVTKALCKKLNCTGLRADATCHCCPRIAIAPLSNLRHDRLLSNVPAPKDAAVLPSDARDTSHVSVPHTSPMWSIKGMLMNYGVDRLDFTFDVRSQTQQNSDAGLSRGPLPFSNLVRQFWWNSANPGPNFEILQCADRHDTSRRTPVAHAVDVGVPDLKQRVCPIPSNAMVRRIRRAQFSIHEKLQIRRKRSWSEADAHALQDVLGGLRLDV